MSSLRSDIHEKEEETRKSRKVAMIAVCRCAIDDLPKMTYKSRDDFLVTSTTKKIRQPELCIRQFHRGIFFKFKPRR